MKNKDLEYIKKHYSETLAKICRKLFPTLLETPGLLPQILEKNFEHSKFLGQDIEKLKLYNSFQTFILSQTETTKNLISSEKTATELFEEAGYILYPECKTEEDIQQFRHYYYNKYGTPDYKKGTKPSEHEGEEICTFSGDRLDTCRVWFAVKKNVDQIKRENFTNPEREDEYGTSVISIQFTKPDNYLSIKCRYNHTVQNPDATFSNNLDNIIPGLTNAFEKEFGIKDHVYEETPFLPDGYVMAENKKLYKIFCITDQGYICENNTIVPFVGEIETLPNYQFTAGKYIIDEKNKKITICGQKDNVTDSFIRSIGKIEKIEIQKTDIGRNIIITTDGKEKVVITINKLNQIIEYKNNNVTQVDHQFLKDCLTIQKLEMKNLVQCGNDFLYNNTTLSSLNLQSLETCGDNFLKTNLELKSLHLPLLKSCGSFFLYDNKELSSLNLPSLETCDEDFLYRNQSLTTLNLPKLIRCGNYFVGWNKIIKEVSLPNLEKCENSFMFSNQELIELNLPKLEECGTEFVQMNRKLKKLTAPNLKKCDSNFMSCNNELACIDLPSLEKCENGFLGSNKKATKISLPSLKSCGNFFLDRNSIATQISIPNLEEHGSFFLISNHHIKEKISHKKILKFLSKQKTNTKDNNVIIDIGKI